jgi:ribose 5-phosphate isomerase B
MPKTTQPLIIALAADHAGFPLKQELAAELREAGYEVVDLGTHSTDSVDYPDFGAAMAAAIAEGRAERGVLVCGTGIGISIAANRHPAVRAALCHDETSARLSREHNDANVLALGARLIGSEVAKSCLQVFLSTSFAGGRHQGRVAKLGAS